VVSVAAPPQVRFTTVVPAVLPDRVTVKVIGSLDVSDPEPSTTAAEIDGAVSLSVIVPVADAGVPTV
jgi:hypothetical protein